MTKFQKKTIYNEFPGCASERGKEDLKLLDRRLLSGVIIVSIPFYIIGFFLLGSFLGNRYGNKSIWIIGSVLVGLTIVMYDVYWFVVRPGLAEEKLALTIPIHIVRSIVFNSFILAFSLSIVSLTLFPLPYFAGLFLGSLLDISTFYLLVFGLARFFEKHSAIFLIFVFLLRLLLKGVILFLAASFPRFLNLWTTFVGILIVELMIIFEALIRSIRKPTH